MKTTLRFGFTSGTSKLPVRPGVARAFRLVWVACLSAPAVVAQTPEKDRQANDCYQARAAYGNDQAACLVILFKWEGNTARMTAIAFAARDRAFSDSIERAEVRRVDAAARRLVREDSIATAVRAARQRRLDSLDLSTGGKAKRELRRVFSAQRDFYAIAGEYNTTVSALLHPSGPTPGVTTSVSAPDPFGWSAEAVDDQGWRCTIRVTGNPGQADLPPIQCEPTSRP